MTTASNTEIPERPELYDAHWMSGLPLQSLASQGLTLCQESEYRFLNGIIRATKPLKLLEVGVHTGGSSMVMLNAIKDNSLAHLYSVDISTSVEGSNEKVGYLVQRHTPELMTQWSLFMGGHTAQFIASEIGEGIDLCFLDTAHTLPGEVLDFLIVLPYMKKDGIIVLHDTTQDHRPYLQPGRIVSVYYLTCIAPQVLYATVRADKFSPLEFNHDLPAPNIAAFRINEETPKYVDDVFLALNLKWRHMPRDDDMEHIMRVLKQHYDIKNVNMFQKNYEVNKRWGVDQPSFVSEAIAAQQRAEQAEERLAYLRKSLTEMANNAKKLR